MCEEEVKKSEEKYRTIFENAPLGIFRSTLEGRFIEVNPALAELLGYTSPREVLDEIHDISSQIYVKTEDRSRIVEESLRNKSVSRYTNLYRKRDGAEFTANLYLTTVRDEHGRPMYFEGIVEDVTERRLMERKLKESEEKYRHLYQNAPAAIYEIDLVRNCIVNVNDVACRRLGYERDELLGMKPRDVLSDAGQQLLSSTYQYNADEGDFPGQIECEMIGKGDRRFWVLMSIRFSYEKGRPAGAAIVAHDITARRLIQEAARKNEERFRLIANNSVDSAFFHDLDLKYIWITRAFAPFTVERILGETDLGLLGGEYAQKIHDFKLDVLKKKKKAKSEFVIPMDDGSLSYYEVTCSPRTNLDGKVIGLSGFMRNITARRQAEEEVRRRETQLKEERKNLEEANAAFKRLLKHRDEEMRHHHDEMLAGMRRLVLPYIERLKNTHLDPSQRDLLGIIESSVSSILPGFSAAEMDMLEGFTPRELEVVNLVKLGYSSRKIAELLDVAEQTVAFHRKNIRKKIGFTEKSQNLRSHLIKISG